MPDVFVSEGDKVDKKDAKVSDTPKADTVWKKRKYHHPFRSYMYCPRGVRFETQQEDEQVLLLLRRHLITNVPWIITALFLVAAPLVLPAFPIIAFLPTNFQIVAVIIWYLVTFAFIMESFLIWFFNVSIVTNKRVVDIDFVNLLYKEVSDAEIEKIEDVTYKVGGGIRTILDYGDVWVQTASEVPNFDFLAVPRPDEVVKLLQELREKV